MLSGGGHPAGLIKGGGKLFHIPCRREGHLSALAWREDLPEGVQVEQRRPEGGRVPSLKMLTGDVPLRGRTGHSLSLSMDALPGAAPPGQQSGHDLGRVDHFHPRARLEQGRWLWRCPKPHRGRVRLLLRACAKE
jgi:hypothetical protein